jgi:hypothetical protein
MSNRALVSGALFKAPQIKMSKSGKPYILATIRSGSGQAVRWWKCFVFAELAIEEISRLGDGDPIAVSGEFDCELYSPAGAESRLNWRITADAILSTKRRSAPKPCAESTRGLLSGQKIAKASLAPPGSGRRN